MAFIKTPVFRFHELSDEAQESFINSGFYKSDCRYAVEDLITEKLPGLIYTGAFSFELVGEIGEKDFSIEIETMLDCVEVQKYLVERLYKNVENQMPLVTDVEFLYKTTVGGYFKHTTATSCPYMQPRLRSLESLINSDFNLICLLLKDVAVAFYNDMRRPSFVTSAYSRRYFTVDGTLLTSEMHQLVEE